MSEESDEIAAEIREFKIQATELCELIEGGLFKLEKGDKFKNNYEELFRLIHTLKGASGMFGFMDLQEHMHNLESLFESLSEKEFIVRPQIDYFLNGIDAAKKLIQEEKITFNYLTLEVFNTFQANAESIIKEIKVIPKTPELPSSAMLYVIDDDPDTVEILSELMLAQGFIVKSFYNGADAYIELETDNPDAILIDLNMPEMSGLDFIKLCFQEKHEIPIIVVSGFLTKQNKIDVIQAGAYAFIEKPFDNERDLVLCVSAVRQQKIMKLLNKSINYILYQFSDLDNFLKEHGKENVRASLKNELASLLELKRQFKTFKIVAK